MSLVHPIVRSFAVLAALSTTLLLPACSGDDPPPEKSDFPEAALASLESDGGALHVEVRSAPTQPPSRGEARFELRLSDPHGAPADGLTLEVTPWMPSMNHGSTMTPEVSADGGGRYVVSHVGLFMAGRWELRTKITGAKTDSFTVAFDVP